MTNEACLKDVAARFLEKIAPGHEANPETVELITLGGMSLDTIMAQASGVGDAGAVSYMICLIIGVMNLSPEAVKLCVDAAEEHAASHKEVTAEEQIEFLKNLFEL